ncbi:MAG: hypothetical protein LBT31_01415 [Synergistaceae bacterium]|nr:hypothetical protein [Synergistaceae bacterium]
MTELAPWELEENNRWKTSDGRLDQTAVAVAGDIAPESEKSLISTATDTNCIATDTNDKFEAEPDEDWRLEEVLALMDVQTANELKRNSAECDAYVRAFTRVNGACKELDKQLAELKSTLFQDCKLKHLPQRYRDISSELEENWKRRKMSRGAIKRGIVLAAELINAYPVYKYYLPLEEPLRLFDCMRERLDQSQLSLVLGKICSLTENLYQDQAFASMRCRACDRLVSFYIRARELDKAIEACDCGMTFEDASALHPKRFEHRKKILQNALERQNDMRNSWSVDYDAKFKNSVSRHDLSNAAFG